MADESPTEPSWGVVRRAPDRDRVEEWALVLSSAAIGHDVLRDADAWALIVAPEDVGSAIQALEAYDLESREDARAVPAPPDHGASLLGAAIAVLLAAMYYVSGARDGASRWFQAGSASAELIMRGELWRAVTALTLHADLVHLAGNGVASLLFIGALARWMGPGLAAWAVLASGTAGNLLTALWHRTGHVSVGASTATFGALGVLAGLQVVHRWRVGPLRKRAWLPLGAGFALFAMLGVGARADVVAHLAGLGMGAGIGAGAGRALRRAWRSPWQALLAWAALAALVAAWVVALRR